MLEDKDYLNFRKVSYWFFVLCFVVLAPVIVLYSVGYKFNSVSKKFQRTGAASIKTSPKDAAVFLDGQKVNSVTPCVLRELMPGSYVIELEKPGFYSYKMTMNIASSSVAEISATLMPEAKNVEKLDSEMDIYKFFVVEQFFGKKLVAFSDKGLYMVDDDFSNEVKVANLNLSPASLNTIVGIRSSKGYIVFWGPNNVWLVDASAKSLDGRIEPNAQEVYSTKESIKDIYFGLNRYLIIHDGMHIVALDFKNPGVIFPVMTTKAVNAGVFYDSSSDILYVRDRVEGSDKFSLFRLNLREIVHDKGTGQTRP